MSMTVTASEAGSSATRAVSSLPRDLTSPAAKTAEFNKRMESVKNARSLLFIRVPLNSADGQRYQMCRTVGIVRFFNFIVEETRRNSIAGQAVLHDLELEADFFAAEY